MDKKQTLVIILTVVLGIGLIVGAYFGYNYLSDKNKSRVDPDLSNPEENVLIDYESEEKERDTASSPPEDEDVKETENIQEPQTEKTGDYADFTVYDKNGKETKLSEKVESGKPVVINFWTTWCGYCKMEMPDFNEVYNEYKDRVEFMMIDICGGGQDDISSAKAYVEEEKFDFPVYYDEDLSALYAYYTTGYPTTIIIDSNANVVYARSGAVSKETLLEMVGQLI